MEHVRVVGHPAGEGGVPAPAPGSSLAAATGVVVAAVDIGAHSTHLLVAAVDGHRVAPLLDTSDILGLGAIVDREARLPGPARAALVATLAGYARAARDLGATEIAVVATEPLRRAAGAARIVAEVEAATGAPCHVVEPEEEGRLTLLGVTGGAPLDADLVLADVGGGSTELVLAGPAGPVRVRGLAIGATRLTDALVSHDPPTAAELAAVRAAADRVLATAPGGRPSRAVVVGGTGSNLARVAAVAGGAEVITLERLAALVEELLDGPAETVAGRFGIRPTRARVLPAGAAIAAALAERYGLDRLVVQGEGIREGTVLALARAGRGWRDRLDRLAHGWAR